VESGKRVVIGLLLALALAGCGRLDGQPAVGAHNGVLLLEPRPRYGQTFDPEGDEVAGVALLVSTFGERVEGRLRVRLRAFAGGPVLAAATVDGRDLRDNRWALARFRRPVAVAGVAAVEVAWRGAGPVGVYVNHPVPGGPGLENDPYPGGHLLEDGAERPGDLAFTVQGPGWATVPATLTAAARTTVARLTARPAFLATWLALLAACAVLAAWPARRPRRRRRSGGGGSGAGGREEIPAAREQLRQRG
jgi:hypothetical protein